MPIYNLYGSKKDLPVLGKFQATIESKEKIVTAEIHVIKGDHGCLLGYATCVELQVVPKIELASVAESKHEVLSQKYSSIFERHWEIEGYANKIAHR